MLIGVGEKDKMSVDLGRRLKRALLGDRETSIQPREKGAEPLKGDGGQRGALPCEGLEATTTLKPNSNRATATRSNPGASA